MGVQLWDASGWDRTLYPVDRAWLLLIPEVWSPLQPLPRVSLGLRPLPAVCLGSWGSGREDPSSGGQEVKSLCGLSMPQFPSG